ncbi:glycopeptide [Boletus edulis]|nr:glycopeptide [Boletus edulis]
MLSSRLLAQVAVPVLLALRANAETHLIKFVNQCGYGTPALMYNGKNVLTGDTYTSNGPFSGIAYLQTGGCNLNGENCTLLETTLINPTCAGCGSSTDISLIPPHKYSVETSFAYYDAPHCDGKGKMSAPMLPFSPPMTTLCRSAVKTTTLTCWSRFVLMPRNS